MQCVQLFPFVAQKPMAAPASLFSFTYPWRCASSSALDAALGRSQRSRPPVPLAALTDISYTRMKRDEMGACSARCQMSFSAVRSRFRTSTSPAARLACANSPVIAILCTALKPPDGE